MAAGTTNNMDITVSNKISFFIFQTPFP